MEGRWLGRERWVSGHVIKEVEPGVLHFQVGQRSPVLPLLQTRRSA